jgi:hypothetical protein
MMSSIAKLFFKSPFIDSPNNRINWTAQIDADRYFPGFSSFIPRLPFERKSIINIKMKKRKSHRFKNFTSFLCSVFYLFYGWWLLANLHRNFIWNRKKIIYFFRWKFAILLLSLFSLEWLENLKRKFNGSFL